MITTNWENSEGDGDTRLPYLPFEKLVCRSRSMVRTGHRTMDWIKLGKEYAKAVYCHPAI